MSFNSSSPSSPSFDFAFLECSNSTVSVLISRVFIVTKAILLLPFSILVLYLGHQQWRQQRSSDMTSHSDVFAYHLATLELVWVLGTAFLLCGFYFVLPDMLIAGNCLFAFVYNGETFFHLFTCVERYLAVVHPITYLGLRNARGVRIRNVAVVCGWLLGLVCSSATLLYWLTMVIIFVSLLVFTIFAISFCSFCVLCVLIRPGPGEGGGNREQVDRSKQRASHTMTAIMGVLLLWSVGSLVVLALHWPGLLKESVSCALVACTGWFHLPTSLVSPLLYLHKVGKLSWRPCNCG